MARICAVFDRQPRKIIATVGIIQKKFCIKYDASLTGLGVGVYNVSTDTLLTFAALQLPFEVNNESKRQNTMEFVAVIFGLL